jgi:hypothetical protein
LATIQVLVPVSFVYTAAWASLAAVWYCRGSIVDAGVGDPPTDDPAAFVTLRILLLLTLTVTLAPSVFTISGTRGQTPLAMYSSPVLILLTLCASVVVSLRPGRAARSPEPAA